MSDRPTELVPLRGELRFEAIYHGVIAAMAVAVHAVLHRPGPAALGAGILIAVAALGLSFALSVGRRIPRGELKPAPRKATIATGRALREHSQRTMPLILLLALLVVAAGETASGVAAACLCGVALASTAGYLHVRSWEGRTGRRAVHGGGQAYAA